MSLLSLARTAAADPLPGEIAAVTLNRNIDMVPVKGGCYKMGDASGEGEENERPAHEVCVKDLIGKNLVTQIQWIGIRQESIGTRHLRTLSSGECVMERNTGVSPQA
jgi:formylglycine-generating enzyme required for sulfatase activity